MQIHGIQFKITMIFAAQVTAQIAFQAKSTQVMFDHDNILNILFQDWQLIKLWKKSILRKTMQSKIWSE